MAEMPGPPPINAPMIGDDRRLTPEWAQWIMQFWLYVKGL